MFRMPLAEGVELGLLEPHHADEVFQAVDADREGLREWLPWVDGTTSPADSRAFLSMQLARLAHGESMTTGIWVDGRFAGVVEGRISPDGIVDIGYWLATFARGRGAATRACRAVLDYAFRQRGCRRAQLRCATANAASCKVAERLGMRLEGVLRSAFPLRDQRFDVNIYSILSDEWPG